MPAPASRRHEITPLRMLEEKDGGKLVLQALSNGPTLAFKDMAMQLLGNLFEYALAQAARGTQHLRRHLRRHRQRRRIRDARQEGHPRLHAVAAQAR